MENEPTFYDLYLQAKNSKPKISPGQQFINEAAELTCRKPATVRMWLFSEQRPDNLALEALSKKYGVSPSSLFPKKPEIGEDESCLQV